MHTPLVRHLDWPERLAAFIESRRRSPFAWGQHDCCLFAADEVLALTGTDLAAELRGAYRTAEEAVQVLRRVGGCGALAARHLPEYARPLMAQRGDVVSVDLDGRETLGVVAGNGCWAAPGEGGLLFRPMAEVLRVFAVG